MLISWAHSPFIPYMVLQAHEHLKIKKYFLYEVLTELQTLCFQGSHQALETQALLRL